MLEDWLGAAYNIVLPDQEEPLSGSSTWRSLMGPPEICARRCKPAGSR
jgi:hypothetical protein